MPISLYDRRKASNLNYVSLSRYLQEVVSDLSGTRWCDESWLSYAFSAYLMDMLDKDPRMPVVRKGLDTALHTGTQKEYADRFGEYILQGRLYDDDMPPCADLCVAMRFCFVKNYSDKWADILHA